MDPQKYTAAAHADLPFANPFSPRAFDRAAELMNLPPGARAADLGCGKGGFAVRLAQRGAIVDAVDRSSRMASQIPPAPTPGALRIHTQDALAFVAGVNENDFDAAACVGSLHALGGLQRALAVLHRIVKPGGWVLIGEGFWERTPDPAYLAATEIGPDEFEPLAALHDAAAQNHLRPLWVVAATPREWDEYEWAHARGLEAFAAANPDDPDAPAMLARSRAWRDAYIRCGRGTLGFALLLCRVEKPA